MNKRKIFNDPVHGFITIPHELIFDLIEHPWFQRLRRIKQLGFSEYVYPGAIHTRFHHALGAFHLMRKALLSLRSKGQEITEEEELGACIAILLHDIGHGPFSHTLEHTLIKGVSHEAISLLFFNRLNEEFGGKLSTAMAIFTDRYPKRFLHQLVSSQLDVDRLDYLSRDSFFTGVSEGVISHDRLIDMLTVQDDELVLEEKGIYSVEKFLVSRRLMYWQVYLHKTVVCAEEMLIRAIERAQWLIRRGEEITAPDSLLFFLKQTIRLADFQKKPELLEYFSRLDDTDILSALKIWSRHKDFVLSYLSMCILQRKLFRVQMQSSKISAARLNKMRRDLSREMGITATESHYLVFTGSTSNNAYHSGKSKIHIRMKNGKKTDIALASDNLNIQALSKPVTKYYVCYPKSRS